MSSWTLRVAPGVWRTLAKLTHPVALSLTELMTGPLVAQPHVVGRPLLKDLSGYRAVRHGPYRVVYRIDDEHRSVDVVRIARGVDRPPYRPPLEPRPHP